MKITLTTNNGVFSLDVSQELTLIDLKALAEMEVEGITKPDSMLLLHNMVPMKDLTKTLGEYNIQEDDVIMIIEQEEDVYTTDPPSQPAAPQSTPQPQRQSFPALDWSSIAVPGGASSAPPAPPQAPVNPDDPDVIRQHLLGDPYQLSILQQRNPALYEAVHNEDPRVFREVYQQHVQRIRDIERDRIRMINAHPFDLEAQTRIAREIQQRNIEENMTAAIEYTPESFSRVVMLYVNIKVNGVPVKALVDSGARATIMSERCAERCNVMRLVDQRFAGVAFGVGRQTIIGKVHLGQIQLGNDFLTSSFQVLKDQAEDMLLGLDMLKRHQCCIDLKEDVLRIGTTGNSVPFLKESELKEKEEMEKQQALASMEDEDAAVANAVTQSQSESAGPSTPQPTASSVSPYPEESIQKIISAGFTREKALQALQQFNGDVQQALVFLIARSLTV